MLFISLDIRRDDYDFPLATKMVDIWRRASELLLRGDYYPHTPDHRDADRWVAWQFDRPEAGCGLIQGIRLPACPDAVLTIYPQALQPSAIYTFENLETGETLSLKGSDLQRDGFSLSLPPRSGALWFYRLIAPSDV